MKRYLFIVSYFLLIAGIANAGKLNKTAGGTTTLNYLVGDGTTDNTIALQNAIDSCSKAGGGTLVIPKGTFVISPITMTSNVNLYLDTLATLLGTPTMANYTVGGKLVNLIGGDSLHNVSITGKGTIDGNGAPWWAAYNADNSISRPRLVYLTKVLNLNIDGITLQNSPSFHIVPNQCKNVYINGITINTSPTSPNTDGIDPSNCINVYITNCTISDGDDNIAIKSDRINGVQTPGTCQNINISNCTFLSGHGLSIGSETDDEVIGVTATNCTFNGTTNGIRIKSNIGLGGLVQNVKYSNIKMTNVENPIVINMAYSSKTGSYPTDTPSVNGFVIDSLVATGASGPAGSLVGLSGAYLKNITLSNVNISAKTGLVLTDATGVTLCNVVITPSSGADIIATNVTYNTATTATITAATATTFCSGESVVLNANTGTGYTYQWSNNGTAISGATAASYTATTAGTYTVTVTSNSCPATSTGVKVTVNALPAAPTVTSPLDYCVGATASALTATGTALKWYTTATGGTGSTTAPTPSTTTAGTTSYYVTQTTNSCESPRATITVTVSATLAAPTVSSPVSYCQGAIAASLTATGTGLEWYTTVTGGTGSTTAPTPSTTSTGTTSYYVSQTSSSCQSPRATIAVTVSAASSAPAVISPVAYCQNATATALTATGTSLTWYTTATGGTGGTTAPTPSTATTGTTNYYVSQTVGCESPRTAITVTVNATPSAPTVTSPVTYCVGVASTALAATGTALKWYTVATGGTGSTTAPTPVTTTTGTTSYYVSQITSGCESPRATIAITINAAPAAPTVTTPVYHCQGSTVAALTATGTALEWYTNATGGTGSTTAPTPLTTTAGTTDYYVSQTTNGCESPRATVAVIVNASPVATITANGPTAFCDTGSVVLAASTGTGYTYQWKDGGTAISGATAAIYTATTAGTYTVTIKNSSNCSATTSGTSVTIITPPSIAKTGNTQYITTTTATMSANTPTIGTGTWSVLSGAGTFANVNSATTSVNGLSVGANVFEWTISNGTCPANSSSVTINVGTALTAQTITGSANVQDNATGVIYSVQSTSGVTKTWVVPTGASIVSYSSDSSQITVNFGTTSGNVSVNESNAFGSVTSSLFVAVGNSPAQQTITGPAYVTGDSSAIYSITTPSGVTNHWAVPAGATITSANSDSSQITVTFGTAGGTLSVTQTNSFGSSVDTETINIGNSPVTQTISGPVYIAIGSTGVTYSVPDNSGSTYHWILPAGATIASASADSSQVTINFGSTGGTVSVTETNLYGSAISSLPVSVGNPPAQQTITGDTSIVANQTGATYSVPDNSGYTYHWALPSGAIITSANTDSSQITVTFGFTGGTVSVTESNPYGNATSSESVSIGTTTSVITMTNHELYILYPNPFSVTATLRINSSEKELVAISIMDVNGVTVYLLTGYTNEDITIGNTISTSGVYFVRAAFGNEIIILKLVKF